jgi:uncharacterized protein YcbK (DUF882 family)
LAGALATWGRSPGPARALVALACALAASLGHAQPAAPTGTPPASASAAPAEPVPAIPVRTEPAAAASAAPAPAAPAPGAIPTASGAPPAEPAASAAPAPAASKKDRARSAKSRQHRASPIAGARPTRLINLHAFWNKEWMAVDPAAPPPPAVIDRFLRDRYTQRSTAMDPRLLPTVLAAAVYFHADVVEIVSGFRHPKYNVLLRKKGHQVARDSQHTFGHAIDFSLPGVPSRRLHTWALAHRLGGVGLYPESGFIHMDTGPARNWSGD